MVGWPEFITWSALVKIYFIEIPGTLLLLLHDMEEISRPHQKSSATSRQKQLSTWNKRSRGGNFPISHNEQRETKQVKQKQTKIKISQSNAELELLSTPLWDDGITTCWIFCGLEKFIQGWAIKVLLSY